MDKEAKFVKHSVTREEIMRVMTKEYLGVIVAVGVIIMWLVCILLYIPTLGWSMWV